MGYLINALCEDPCTGDILAQVNIRSFLPSGLPHTPAAAMRTVAFACVALVFGGVDAFVGENSRPVNLLPTPMGIRTWTMAAVG